MISRYINHILWFIMLVFIQVIFLNNVQVSGFINPFLYIIFILWLPIETPNWLLMVIATITGLFIDLFSHTLGMHMSACIFLSFCRPYILNLLAPRDGYESNLSPNIQNFGFSWFLTYACILTLLHHIFLFFVEIFRFNEFFSTLGRALLSSVMTLVLIFILQLFRYNSEAKR